MRLTAVPPAPLSCGRQWWSQATVLATRLALILFVFGARSVRFGIFGLPRLPALRLVWLRRQSSSMLHLGRSVGSSGQRPPRRCAVSRTIAHASGPHRPGFAAIPLRPSARCATVGRLCRSLVRDSFLLLLSLRPLIVLFSLASRPLSRLPPLHPSSFSSSSPRQLYVVPRFYVIPWSDVPFRASASGHALLRRLCHWACVLLFVASASGHARSSVFGASAARHARLLSSAPLPFGMRALLSSTPLPPGTRALLSSAPLPLGTRGFSLWRLCRSARALS